MPASTNGTIFVELIEAAYNSICCDEDDWDRAKTNALDCQERLPPEFGFARYVIAEAENSHLTEEQRKRTYPLPRRRRLSALEAAEQDIRDEIANWAKRDEH